MKTFGEPLQNPQIRNVAVAIIVDSENNFYLRKDNDDGYVQLVRGGIESNELPEQAAVREVKEETGFFNIESVSKIDFEYEVYEQFGDIKRKSTCYPFLVRLKNLDKKDKQLTSDEFKDFEVVSVPIDKVLEFLKKSNAAQHTYELLSFFIGTK